MQGASRESLGAAQDRLDEQTRGADLDTVSDELFSVAALLVREFALRRALSDPSTPSGGRAELLESVLGGQISPAALDILRGVVRARWSRPPDLTDAIEDLGRQVVFIAAEAAGVLDEVEDELFRFGRILDREPRLAAALADRTASPERRIELTDSLLRDKTHAPTRQLLDHVIAEPRERSLDRIIDDLSKQAAARRSRSIALVRSAVALTPDQQTRLAASLRRIYGRDIALQVEVDRDLLGGLVVQIEDDVIDGSVASRLAAAARGLTNR
jgi:F-type H+-transporting ATPase subunit delta